MHLKAKTYGGNYFFINYIECILQLNALILNVEWDEFLTNIIRLAEMFVQFSSVRWL